jgi:hypothetical protein
MAKKEREFNSKDVEVYVNDLFNDFRKGIFLQYLFTLVRVGSLDSYAEEPFDKIFKKILRNDINLNLDKEDVFWSFLLNVIFVSRQGSYNPYIFYPKTDNFREGARKKLSDAQGKYSDIVDVFFPKIWEKLNDKQKNEALYFAKQIYIYYKKALRLLTKYPKLIKLQSNFDVLELLVNYKIKMVEGFKIHFSNGSHALFKRTNKQVMCLNLDLGSDIVGVMVGSIDEMKNEWMVGNKPLYEIGLPFRYNKLGEWKPIILPGKSDTLQERAREQSNDDSRVASVLFYIFCTGHRVIEFVAKSPLKLPEEITSFKTGLHLYQVKGEDKDEEMIIDGWIELNSIEIDELLVALDIIEKTFSFLSFTFDVPIEWTLKYNIINQNQGIASPTKEEMAYLNKILRGLKNDPDNFIISSVDWFERGVSSRNIFNKFICFYLAIETLALKLATGKIKKSEVFGISEQARDDEEIKKCVKKLYDLHFDRQPRVFIDKAYFECSKPINQNLKISLSAVFGENSWEYEEFFKNKPTITEIRGKLMHESYSNWSKKQQIGLKKKLPKLEEIAKNFILRICFEALPTDKLHKTTHEFGLKMFMDNPNSVLVASDKKLFPTTDWKIKASWINPRNY